MTATQLEQTYDTYSCGLFHYFQSFTRAEADARDLLQDFFSKLSRITSPNPQSEKAWLYGIAHRLALDWLRRRDTRIRYERQSGEAMPRLFQLEADPDSGLLAGQLEHALLALPEEQRSVAQLKLWEGMSFEEIATVQGIPQNTAASRYRYALEKLREHLRPLYEELT